MALDKTYTIGFTQRRAEDFFGTLINAGIKTLIDVRLNNSSQLAGFTKQHDLPFFLSRLCDAEYIHEPLLAPSANMLRAYRKKQLSWPEYEKLFVELMAERRIEDQLSRSLFSKETVLLCSEFTAEQCHRRLVLSYLQEKWGDITIVHL